MRETNNTNSLIKFETKMLMSSLFSCSDAYVPIKETITIPNTEAAGAEANNANKKIMLKNCDPFIDCMSEINNT